MQAILTRALPPTNTKPARIEAKSQRGSICIPRPDNLDTEDAHIYACNILKDKFAKEDRANYGQPIDGNPWMRPTVCGWLPNGDCAHVFVR